MKVTVKLYAMLGRYLPTGATDNQVIVETPEDAAVGAVLAGLGVPSEHCHLVLVNGGYVPPSARDGHRLRDGDALAVWPPVAGG